jgi:amino-acid N-acetyltransferase
MPTHFIVRNASETDQRAIVDLVRSERLNPNDLDWRRFAVATLGGIVVGAAQMRRHPDRACELGSLVVEPGLRGQGIAARLIEHLLSRPHGDGAPTHVVTAARNARHYRRWDFRRISLGAAPRSVRRNYLLGQILGGLHALLRGRPPRRLVILRRI